MKSLGRWLVSGAIAATLLPAVPTAVRAGVDISFGAAAPIGDDGRLFVSISSHYFNRDVRVVDDWSRRFSDPDDLAVFLHICSQTRTTPEIVFSYRRQGMTWFDISNRVGVPVDSWFVPVNGDPGPPYGKAYGYWRHHQNDPHYRVRLTDGQCRDLIAVRMAHDYYHVPPQQAMDWRRQGHDVSYMMNREYRSRHGQGQNHDRDNDHRGGGDHHDRGDDHDHDHGPGHGHDKGNNR